MRMLLQGLNEKTGKSKTLGIGIKVWRIRYSLKSSMKAKKVKRGLWPNLQNHSWSLLHSCLISGTFDGRKSSFLTKGLKLEAPASSCFPKVATLPVWVDCVSILHRRFHVVSDLNIRTSQQKGIHVTRLQRHCCSRLNQRIVLAVKFCGKRYICKKELISSVQWVTEWLNKLNQRTTKREHIFQSMPYLASFASSFSWNNFHPWEKRQH